MFCFCSLALPEVWSSYLWRRRWIWDIHPWLPPLQKEDSYVSKAKINNKNLMQLRLYFKVFLCVCVCVCVCVYLCSDAAETVIHSADAFAPVGYLRFTEMHTESKDSVSRTSEGVCERNLFYKQDQCHSMPNRSFYNKSSSHCWVDYFKNHSEGKTNTRTKPFAVW